MQPLRSIVVLGIVISAGLAAASASAAPKVLVVASRGSNVVTSKGQVPDPAHARGDISGTVATAAGTTGVEIVDAAPLAAAGLTNCTSPQCARRLGAATGASFVLIADAKFDLDRFEVRLDIWNTASGEHVDGEGDTCDGCSHTDFLRSLRARTTFLCERAFRAPPAQAAVATPPASVVATPSNPSQSPPATDDKSRWIGGGLIGAGVLAGVASGLLFAVNNNKLSCSSPPGDPDPCSEQRKTLTPAIISGAAAVVAIGAGIIVIGVGGGEHRIGLSVQPNGLALGGRL